MSKILSFTPELFVLGLQSRSDDRGYFREMWKRSEYLELSLPEFHQDNVSVSRKGVLRGLHYQDEPHGQGKLVTVLQGAVWDVAVDIRPHSAAFGKSYFVTLTEENGYQFYIPPGFAHGFVVLSESATFLYKCTHEYVASADKGILWSDPHLAIPWPVAYSDVIVSSKDSHLPGFLDVFSKRS